MGGHVLATGGWGPLVYSAGYVGTLLVAAFLFWCSARIDTTRIGLGAMTILVAVYMVISARGVAVLASFLFLAYFFTFVMWSGYGWLQFAVTRVLGICLAIDGIADFYRILFKFGPRRTQSVWDPVLQVPEKEAFYTDATMMAAHYGGSEGAWAVAWLVLSLLILGLGIAWSVRAEIASERELREKTKVHPGYEFKKGEGKPYRIR